MQTGRLERALGHSFLRRELVQQALTHRSHGTDHNERLEFLGDSILNCVIAMLLFERFAALREGDLSRLRANLVRQATLFEIAQKLGLGDELRLGEGELRSGGHRRPSILADGLEALLGAVYLDAGFGRAYEVISQLYQPHLAAIDPGGAAKDPKTALQEILQARHLALPHYALCAAHGEAHAQEFEVECRIAALSISTFGVGANRRAAEQAAAQRAIELIAEKSAAK